MSDQEVEEFLEHFGVKGMRWGVQNRSLRKEAGRQEHINRLKKISDGTATREERAAVRKKTGTTTKPRANRELQNPKETKMLINNKRNQKVRDVATGLVVAAWVASLFISNAKLKTSNIRPPSSTKAKSVANLINDRRNVEVSSLTRMHKEGKMDDDQLKNFSKILNARYDRKIAEALKTSK